VFEGGYPAARRDRWCEIVDGRRRLPTVPVEVVILNDSNCKLCAADLKDNIKQNYPGVYV